MAQFSIEVADSQVERLIAAICGIGKYEQAKYPGEEPAAFANRYVRVMLTVLTEQWETSGKIKAAVKAITSESVDKLAIEDPARR